MVNIPFVVSKCALKVSGAVAVSFAGSAKSEEAETTGVFVCICCVLLQETSAKPAMKMTAQIKFNVFMAGEFSTRARKSHARNYFRSFIERVMRLESVLRMRNHTKIPNAAAAIEKIPPIASAPPLTRPELFDDDADNIFVCMTILVGGAAMTFVCATGTIGGGAFVGFGAGGGGFAGTFAFTFVPTMMSDGTTTDGAGGGGVDTGA